MDKILNTLCLEEMQRTFAAICVPPPFLFKLKTHYNALWAVPAREAVQMMTPPRPPVNLFMYSRAR